MTDIDHAVEQIVNQWEKHDRFRLNEGEPTEVKIAKAYAAQAAEIAELRAKLAAAEKERDTLMTALDGLLNDFIKAVPSSEPIDCHKFTRYQPALLAYVTVRDRKPLDQHNPREVIKESEATP